MSRIISVWCLSMVTLVLAAAGDDGQQLNDCSFSMKKQILTCERIALKDSNIGNTIGTATQMLVIRRSANLTITPGFHSPPFRLLTSYHLTECPDLQVSPFSFQQLPNLKYIKIIDNTYTTVASNTFYGLVNLEVLSLNNNSINTIETDAFNGLSSLETLELTHNNFKAVSAHVFASLHNLRSLFLYHNNIEVLEDDCLFGLSNLNVLDLTYNRITRIKTAVFDAAPVLTQLYLSFNQIETVEGDFTSEKLEFLYLQNNKLRNVTDTLFNSLVNLVDVDLSRNKITSFAPDAFINLTRLNNLNYKDNNLERPVHLQFADKPPLITS